jgi:Na+-translocating ferredoxin:NAD+ oxidoreductase RnfA subunit
LQARLGYLFASAATTASALAFAVDLVIFNALRAAINAATPLQARFGSEMALVAVSVVLLALASFALSARRRAMAGGSGKA